MFFLDLAVSVRVSAANRGARPNTRLVSICVVSLQVVHAHTLFSWMAREASGLSKH